MREEIDLEIMVKLKDRREQQIKDNLEEGEPLKAVINDVKYLGKVKFIEEIDGQNVEQEKDIYLLIEEDDGKIWYKYYDENLGFIAAEDVLEEQIIFGEKFENKNIELLKQIKELDKQEGISLSEMEEEYISLEDIALQLGIDPDDVTSYTKLDLKQEIGQKEDENITLNKEQTNSLNIKEKTNLNQNINGRTLENKLGIDNMTLSNGEKLTDGKYLAVVSTSSLDKYTNQKGSQKYSFAVIRENGEAVPVGNDILEPDARSGTNSMKSDLTINNDGIVNEESNVSSFKIVNGNRNEYLKIGNDEVSGHEIKYSEYSAEDGIYVSTELRTDRNMYIDDDVRQYLKDGTEGRDKASDTVDRAKLHEDCDEKDVTLVDDVPNNDSHVHVDENDYIPGTRTTWREFANACGDRENGAIERAQEKFEKECAKSENLNLSSQEIVDNIVEEVEEDYGPEHDLNH